MKSRTRILSLLAGLVLGQVVWAGPAPAATAGSAGVTANCGGFEVVSANYLHLVTYPYTDKLGSIQLCKRPDNTYFSRLEMYDTLPYGRFANGFVYYTPPSQLESYYSCDDHPSKHIGPGDQPICYTDSVLNSDTVHHLYGVGRAYILSGGRWVVYAEGYTEVGD